MDIYERQDMEKEKEKASFEKDLNQAREISVQKKSPTLANTKETSSLPKANSFLTAFREISPMEDWVHFLIIAFSVVADMITLIPYLGAFMALFFSCIFYTLYFVSGQLKNRALAKIFVSSVAYFLELIGGIFILGLFPFFTFSAVLIYWLELSCKQQNKEKNNA